MTAAYPATLPGINNDGSATITPNDGVLRTSFDTGVPKTRLRFTAVTTPVSYSIMLTPAQVTILENFYKTTLSKVFQFTWIDWRFGASGPTVNYRFTAAPSYVPRQDAADGTVVATLQLEIMP